MTLQLTLERDGHDQPWGFRLQGGVDVGLPLSVQRVLVGTPAEPVLKKGDVVSKISQTGAQGLSHQQAVDLFNNAGNQINVTVKRGGVVGQSSQPSISSIQASVAIKQQQQHQKQQSAAAAALAASEASGDPNQSPQVAALPRTTFVLKSALPPPVVPPTYGGNDISVTNQPYRTLPLVQPSVKSFHELGPGSSSHLRLQEEICTGLREPQLVPVSPAQANAIKANDLIMKQKVGALRSFRARSPDPSVSIRSLLRPTPLFRGRPAWKESSFSSAGRNQFRVGGQVVALKPTGVRSMGGGLRSTGGFKPKQLMTPSMWRTMLKATPVKAKPKPKPKEEREALPEVTLRKEKIIQIATRDIMEEYCDQVVKEGLPGKKCKPKPSKYKVHEGIVGPAKMTEVEVKFIQGKRAVQISVVIRRYEEYEDVFTVGDKSNLPPGPCASFTFSLDYKNETDTEKITAPEKTFQTVDVAETVNVTTCYDPMSLDY